MARPLSWLDRIYPIAKAVAGSARSHYSRGDLELLFELQPRSAQQLMASLPHLSIGRARLVEREALHAFLERLSKADNPSQEYALLRAKGGPAVRRKLRSLSFQDVSASLDAPPGNVTLSPGEVTVRFQTADELAQAMLYLASILQGELDAFVSRYELPILVSDPISEPEREQERQKTEQMRSEQAFYREWQPATDTPSGLGSDDFQTE